MELTELTIKEAHEGLKNKEFTSVDLAKAYLEKIKKTVDRSGKLWIITTI